MVNVCADGHTVFAGLRAIGQPRRANHRPREVARFERRLHQPRMLVDRAEHRPEDPSHQERLRPWQAHAGVGRSRRRTDQSLHSGGAHSGNHVLDAARVRLRLVPSRGDHGDDRVVAGNASGRCRGVEHVGLHDPELLVTQRHRPGAADRGCHPVSVGQRLLDNEPTGASGCAEDEQPRADPLRWRRHAVDYTCLL
jgi:hypothetical protein